MNLTHMFITGYFIGFMTMLIVWFLSVRNNSKITQDCCLRVSECINNLMSKGYTDVEKSLNASLYSVGDEVINIDGFKGVVLSVNNESDCICVKYSNVCDVQVINLNQSFMLNSLILTGKHYKELSGVYSELVKEEL